MCLASLFLVIPKQVIIKKMFISTDTQKTKTHRGVALMIPDDRSHDDARNSFGESQCTD